MRWAAVVVWVALISSGCLGLLASDEPCQQPELWTLAGPIASDGRTSRDDAADFLVWARNPMDRDAPVKAQAQPDHRPPKDGYVFAPGGDVVASNETLFASFWVGKDDISPVSDGGNVTVDVTLGGDDACGPPTTSRTVVEYGEPHRGDAVQSGNGALVHTAGFWRDNGTLFYTNMDRVHNDTRFTRAGWYEYGGGDPLKVYVYNGSRDEMPPRYEEAGYSTTIYGFNLALHYMVTTAGAIADIPPERAYTKPEYSGNETTEPHVLYGDALVFWIEVVEVTSVRCPVGVGPVCEAPDVPPTRA